MDYEDQYYLSIPALQFGWRSWNGLLSLIWKQKEIHAQLEKKQLIPESEDKAPREVTISTKYYNIATSGGKTTTQLDPLPELGGGSENFNLVLVIGCLVQV